MAAGHKTGGRTKGTPNRVTSQVRELILAALDEAGGQDYLVRQARENPAVFLGLVGKILPRPSADEISGPVTIKVVTGDLAWRSGRGKAWRRLKLKSAKPLRDCVPPGLSITRGMSSSSIYLLSKRFTAYFMMARILMTRYATSKTGRRAMSKKVVSSR